MIPRLVGLVADDLTGATDAAVPFAAAGWSAHLLRTSAARLEPGGGVPTLLAVATGVRAAGDEEAAAGTAAAVKDLLVRGCDRLFLKIDSTMRGSVAGQVRGALAAWSEAHPDAAAVLCPAFPDQGRTVAGGRVLVGGVPLDRTAAADDPVTRVTTSLLTDLVPGATIIAPARLTASRMAAAGAPSDAGLDVLRVTGVDAATDADLDAIAAALDGWGSPGIAVGSAGLASALARHWRVELPAPSAPQQPIPQQPPARILVAVSSLHPLAVASVARLRAERPAVDVITTPAARSDAATAAADFGDRVAGRLAVSPYDALVLVGGDGAAAALDRVSAAAVTVHSALAPGVPLGTIRGGAAHGVLVVTKSGGFGRTDSLVEIVDRLGNTRKEHP